MPSEMTRWIRSAMDQRRERRAEEDAARAELKLLPSDLAERIAEAAEAEQMRQMVRYDGISEHLDHLRDQLSEAREEARDALGEIEVPARTRHDWRGEARTIPGQTVLVATSSTIEKRRVTQRISGEIEYWEQQRGDAMAKARDAAKIRDQAAEGVVTVLLEITSRWQGRFEIGQIPGLDEAIRKARAVPTDPTGDPLPTEALEADGTAPAMRGRVDQNDNFLGSVEG